MVRKLYLLMFGALLVALVAIPATAQNLQRENDDDQSDRDDNYSNRNDYGERARIDRYLDVEVWSDQSDGEYYQGDNITLRFRANRDCFVAIYSIDSRGRVNLLFPAERNDDNYILGDQTYSLPGPNDDYDLEVSGPAGRENIQIIASRERFPIPNWYHNSGLVCGSDDDRDEFMDDLNNRYFVKYDGQRFGYDRAVIFVQEWEPDYFRPIYYPVYPSWSVCGNLYIDYPWGAAVYIDGIYWGCAPLYIPRILVGWQTVTIYDHWGYCWEHDVHVSRYNTVVLDRHIVRPAPGVLSKYKEVRAVGYRDPEKSGYPHYKETIGKLSGRVASPEKSGGDKLSRGKTTVTDTPDNLTADLPKKYTRGTTNIVQTSRGIESAGGYDNDTPRSSVARKSARSGSGDNQSGSAGNWGSPGSSGSSDNYGSSSGKRVKRGTSGDQGSVSTGQDSGNRGGNSGSSEPRKSEPTVKAHKPSQPSGGDSGSKGHGSSPQPKGEQKVSQPRESGGKSGGEAHGGSRPQSGSSGNSAPKQSGSGGGKGRH